MLSVAPAYMPTTLKLMDVMNWPAPQSLGDKLQRLAWLSPPHVHAVEHLVDLFLKRVS